MAVVNTLIGHIKGPKGDTGETGATGATGAAGADATVTVGSTTTVPYGQTARVTNTGTPGAAVFNFTIPQGKPGEQTTKIDNLTIDAITEPSTRFPVPAIGDNGSTLFGKISKWFSDMAALVATKFNAANVVNNLTTTASGYALDARQGKALSDKVGSLFTVYERQVHQNRLTNAGLREIRYTLPDGNHMSIVYCNFKTAVAISKDGAIATGFSQALGLYFVNISGNRNDTHAVQHFYINSSGGLCVYEAIPAGVWCSCNGVYLTNG